MWRWMAGLWLLLLVGSAGAVVLDGRSARRGVLATGQTVGGAGLTGASANQVDLGDSWKGRWIFFEYVNTSGTATVHVDVNCANKTDADFNTRWIEVPGTEKIMGVGITAAGSQVVEPGCMYRTSIDLAGDCSGCNVTTRYVAGPESN